MKSAYSQIGRQLSMLSRKLGFEIRSIEDSSYGNVGIYHKDVINEFKTKLDDNVVFMNKYRKTG